MSKIKVLNSQKGYNLAAADYDKKESYLDSFENDKLLPLLGDLKEKKVLDVGAGTGRLAMRLSRLGAKVVALDISSEMLGVLKMKSQNLIDTVEGDAENLPFVDENFDVVISAFHIVHLKNLKRFFDEAYRVLKPGGKFLVTNINQKRPPEIKTKEGMIEIESYYHRPEEVREVLEELAFGIEKEEMIKEGGVWINQIVLATK